MAETNCKSLTTGSSVKKIEVLPKQQAQIDNHFALDVEKKEKNLFAGRILEFHFGTFYRESLIMGFCGDGG